MFRLEYQVDRCRKFAQYRRSIQFNGNIFEPFSFTFLLLHILIRKPRKLQKRHSGILTLLGTRLLRWLFSEIRREFSARQLLFK